VLAVILPFHTMSANSFWSNACSSARAKSLQTLQDATYASCIATVTQAHAPLLCFCPCNNSVLSRFARIA
jgi:hypothetical protein